MEELGKRKRKRNGRAVISISKYAKYAAKDSSRLFYISRVVARFRLDFKQLSI